MNKNVNMIILGSVDAVYNIIAHASTEKGSHGLILGAMQEGYFSKAWPTHG